MCYSVLENIVGRRYASLDLLKNDIEVFTEKNVTHIVESDSDKFEEMDFMIDYEIEGSDKVYTLFYLKDNGGSYYITEV